MKIFFKAMHTRKCFVQLLFAILLRRKLLEIFRCCKRCTTFYCYHCMRQCFKRGLSKIKAFGRVIYVKHCKYVLRSRGVDPFQINDTNCNFLFLR